MWRMRVSIRLLAIAAPIAVLLALAAAMQGPAQKWRLVWSDEFAGDKLDYTKWGVAFHALGGGNNELQFYTDRAKNVRVADGKLVLAAHADDFNGMGTVRKYSSGSLRTKHRGDWKYGRFEVCARLPAGQGLWPAIWMLPTDDAYGGWARSGEIDIMEYRGDRTDHVIGTLHYGDVWPKNAHSGDGYTSSKKSFADDFHVFALEWEEGVMRWYVDGKLYQTQTKWHTQNAKFPAPFDQRFHLILNLAVGGRFSGNPDATTKFPARMLVDWVRVYQR